MRRGLHDLYVVYVCSSEHFLAGSYTTQKSLLFRYVGLVALDKSSIVSHSARQVRRAMQ